jgi:Uma2 family endonuclease
LIEGAVYVPSPVSTDDHGGPHFDLISWLGVYRALTPGVQGGDNATVRLGRSNVPQPDVFLRILPECGGRSRTVDGYVRGAPELVAEVAASSVSYDLHDKLRAYRRHGVQEYLVWRVEDGAIDWFVRRERRFVPLQPDAAGLLKSEAFPGLWLDPAALLRRDLARVFRVAQQGLATKEHTAFVVRLRNAAQPPRP